jgi:hypothetical protein
VKFVFRVESDLVVELRKESNISRLGEEGLAINFARKTSLARVLRGRHAGENRSSDQD